MFLVTNENMGLCLFISNTDIYHFVCTYEGMYFRLVQFSLKSHFCWWRENGKVNFSIKIFLRAFNPFFGRECLFRSKNYASEVRIQKKCPNVRKFKNNTLYDFHSVRKSESPKTRNIAIFFGGIKHLTSIRC